jgi:hypothetical protein
LAWGRGRIEVASAEAVLFAGRETRGRFSKSTKARLGDVLCRRNEGAAAAAAAEALQVRSKAKSDED